MEFDCNSRPQTVPSRFDKGNNDIFTPRMNSKKQFGGHGLSLAPRLIDMTFVIDALGSKPILSTALI
jgi:hypothetical protein